MTTQVLILFAHRLIKPLADLGAIYVIVINPAFVAGIVRRIDVDAFHLPGVVWKEIFKGKEIVAFNQEIAGSRIADGELGNLFQQVKRHLPMMILNRLPPDPIQCRHENPSITK